MDEVDLVVVGGGPRALSALLDLDSCLAEMNRHAPRLGPYQVAVVDPAPAGPGAVWRTDQPTHLLMNVNADLVDFRSRLVEQTFRSWADQHLSVAEANAQYPSRAAIGRYLEWCFGKLRRSPHLKLAQLYKRAVHVAREDRGWLVRLEGGCAVHAAQVLLCTGHEDQGGVRHAELTKGSAEQRVTIAGSALTAIDVVLDLTEGRGGCWNETEDSSVEGAGSRLCYSASGREPQHMVLTNRSGEFLIPKPVAASTTVAESIKQVTSIWRHLTSPDQRWWTVLIQAAQAGAGVAGVRVERAQLLRALELGRGTGDVWARWYADLERADGLVDDDPSWWLGRAWAVGYQDLVLGLERAPRDIHWPVFRERAQRLERWAFGPPPQTVRRLLALHEAGLLSYQQAVGEPQVRAVTAAPGIRGSVATLWRGLMADGLVSTRSGERGAWTTADAQCVGKDGYPVPGLYALGRATEDPVIGHDTLSRRLHRDPLRWAQRVADTWRTAALPVAPARNGS